MEAGSLAWVLISAALVLFMTPGLAFFYGGMDRSRNVLNMLMMNFYCILIVPVVWVVVGYSLATGTNDFIGNFDKAFLDGVGIMSDNGAEIATIAFLGMFACITPALISGAVADRMKFSAWAIFVPVWLLLVYVPVFKWIYGGWLGVRGSLDFAGGTAIHVNAGIAALAASGQAAQAFMNTFLAAAAAGLVWVIIERLRDGHATNLGAASGIVAGLVAITPAAGYVSGAAPLAIGAIAGAVCCYAVKIKMKAGFDDALDVVGVHFVGGLVGSLTIGFFANPDFFGGGFMEGIFYGGGPDLLIEQLIANAVTIVYAFVMTTLIMLALKATIGVRVSEEVEASGLDQAEHAETAYHSGASAIGTTA